MTKRKYTVIFSRTNKQSLLGELEQHKFEVYATASHTINTDALQKLHGLKGSWSVLIG